MKEMTKHHVIGSMKTGNLKIHPELQHKRVSSLLSGYGHLLQNPDTTIHSSVESMGCIIVLLFYLVRD
jgi:hypothetical protein